MAVLDSADLIPLWRVDRILHNGRDVLILPAQLQQHKTFFSGAQEMPGKGK